jgi:hypothetical protein
MKLTDAINVRGCSEKVILGKDKIPVRPYPLCRQTDNISKIRYLEAICSELTTVNSYNCCSDLF